MRSILELWRRSTGILGATSTAATSAFTAARIALVMVGSATIAELPDFIDAPVITTASCWVPIGPMPTAAAWSTPGTVSAWSSVCTGATVPLEL